MEIYSLCRSGTHAIIFWIINNLGGFTKEANNHIFINEEIGLFYYNNCNHHKYYLPKKYKILIRNYEDILPKNNTDIIIIRDFGNLLASRYKKYGDNLGLSNEYITDIYKLIDVWKNMIKSNNYKIYYDKWLISNEYRNKICNDLGIINKDKIDYVSAIGNGSSFIGINLEENNEEYLKRYNFLNDKYKTIIKSDNELIQLNLMYFNNNLLNI